MDWSIVDMMGPAERRDLRDLFCRKMSECVMHEWGRRERLTVFTNLHVKEGHQLSRRRVTETEGSKNRRKDAV